MTQNENPQMELARRFVENTSQSVFLTGRAGTGKTTFLRRVKDECTKTLVVTAPTGVAAINAQGVTLHSLFQIAPGIHLGDNRAEGRGSFFRMSERKKQLLRSMQLLIIDEISMVRCDLLDEVDRVLRRFRRNSLPFGGVQLLLIGDLQQLAPVAKENEWTILRDHYDTPYFFSAHALKDYPLVTIELQHIYRQADREFISILQQIRTNSLTAEGRNKLNARWIPDFNPPDKGNWIRLTTHNATAAKYNNERLTALSAPSITFRAEVEGNFPENSYPTDLAITLKKGAQVMFVKNDPAGRFFNGKIGRVSYIDRHSVSVICEGEDSPIDVKPMEWENIRYDVDDDGSVHEVLDGVFTQLPLRLAWAITVHKSQGLTFRHAILDISHSFAHGQAYVALSRCRTLEGLVLTTRINPSSIICDHDVDSYLNQQLQFSHDCASNLPRLEGDYLIGELDNLFSFQEIIDGLQTLLRVCSRHVSLAQQDFVPVIEKAANTLSHELTDVAHRFHRQYAAIIQAGQNDPKIRQISGAPMGANMPSPVGANAPVGPQIQRASTGVHPYPPALNDRLTKAKAWFLGRFREVMAPVLAVRVAKFVNKEAKKQYIKAFTALKDAITTKEHALAPAS